MNDLARLRSYFGGPWTVNVATGNNHPYVYFDGEKDPNNLEIDNQGSTPWIQASSCLGCHFPAPTAYQPYGNDSADFDFQLIHAQSDAKKKPQ